MLVYVKRRNTFSESLVQELGSGLNHHLVNLSKIESVLSAYLKEINQSSS